MTENIDHERELITSLFQGHSIEVLLKNFAFEGTFSKYSKKFLDRAEPLSFICSCTCEGLLGQSYLYTSSFLNMLVCLKQLKTYRLAYGNDIKLFEQRFRGTLLENDPLYKISGRDTRSDKFIKSEYNALMATEKILEVYSSEDVPYFMHPFNVYWFLVKKLQIDTRTASVYHSTQGLIRLIIIYLLNYKNFQDGIYIDDGEILNLYDSLTPEIEKEEQVVLPEGVNYDIKKVKCLLTKFFKVFVDKAIRKEKEAKLIDLSAITNLAIQTIRIVNEYQGASIKKEMSSIIAMMDNQMLKLFSELESNSIARYHFIKRWREKCKIITRYNPIEFIDEMEDEKDNVLFSILSSMEPNSTVGV